jgi:hypothetical protein
MLETAPFIFALAVLVAAVFWILLRHSSAKIEAQYRRLAEDMGLDLEIPSTKLAGFVRHEPAAYGRYRGREISFSVPGKGLQNTRQIETVLKLELRDKRLNAQLTAAGLMGRLGQRDSGKKARWQSGDTAFDEAVDVRSDAGERLTDLLDAERRRWIADLLQRSKATIYIGGGTLAYARLGLIANDATRLEFEAACEFLCDLAKTVEADSSLNTKKT